MDVFMRYSKNVNKKDFFSLFNNTLSIPFPNSKENAPALPERFSCPFLNIRRELRGDSLLQMLK